MHSAAGPNPSCSGLSAAALLANQSFTVSGLALMQVTIYINVPQLLAPRLQPR